MIVRPSKRRSGSESNHPRLVAKPVESFLKNTFYKSYGVNKYAKHKATQASPRQVCTRVSALKNMSSRLFSPPSSLRLFNDPLLFALFLMYPLTLVIAESN